MDMRCIFGHNWFMRVENGQNKKICDICHKRKIIKEDFDSDNYAYEQQALDRSGKE